MAPEVEIQPFDENIEDPRDNLIRLIKCTSGEVGHQTVIKLLRKWHGNPHPVC